MNMRSFHLRLCRPPIPHAAAVMLVMLIALASGRPAFCDAIHDAARDGDLGTVKALLKGNRDLVYSRDAAGKTSLHWAAEKGHKDVVKLLLADKADVNARDNSGATPLHYAAANGHQDVAEWLRRHGGRDIAGASAAANAAPAASISAANDKFTKFSTALQAGDIATVDELLQSGVDINFRFNPHAKRSQNGRTFAWTWFAVDEKTMDGAFPLFIAAENGRAELANDLIARGANLNLRTNYGATALIVAAQGGHLEIVNVLLAKGADVTIHTDFGWTALMAASYRGWDEVIRALIKGGADANEKGDTLALPTTMGSGRPTDNARQIQVTPLYLACLAHQPKAASALLESGALPNIAMSNGETALDGARLVKNAEEIELLTKAGAKPGVGSAIQ